MADKLVSAISEIRSRIENAGVKSSPIPIEVDDMLNVVVGADIDPSKITYTLLQSVQRFNDEAGNDISFVKGEILRRDDILLFVLIFNIGECNGYIN